MPSENIMMGSIRCPCGSVIFSHIAWQTIETTLLPGVISVQEILSCVVCKDEVMLERIVKKIDMENEVILLKIKELKGAFC